MTDKKEEKDNKNETLLIKEKKNHLKDDNSQTSTETNDRKSKNEEQSQDLIFLRNQNWY